MEEETVMSSASSSIGEAVSGRGEAEDFEEEDLYYIPERRPSLDLETTPMDTGHWYRDLLRFSHCLYHTNCLKTVHKYNIFLTTQRK